MDIADFNHDRHNTARPVVMVFSGHDPTGGAGIQADIEAVASLGCHAAPVVTSITVQDTSEVKVHWPLDCEWVIEQARVVLEDIPVAAFKIGVLGSSALVETVHTLLADYPDVPVILDPVLHSASGYPFGDNDLVDAVTTLLLPRTFMLTPNSIECYRLAPAGDCLDACAQTLLACGCQYVLVTGTHEPTAEVQNVLYGNRRRLEVFHWPRLANSFHGSGCTLASAIAALVAQGFEPLNAARNGQRYTWETLAAGMRVGMGQALPNRFYWIGVKPVV